MQKIATFEDSILGAKLLGGAVMAGRLDDGGDVARFDAEDLVYQAGVAIGVNGTVTPEDETIQVVSGRDSAEGWTVERRPTGSNVRYLPTPEERESVAATESDPIDRSYRVTITA